MGDDTFNRFRLSLMQDFLPVSLAMVERIRKGGAGEVVDVFTSSQDPLQDLRVEGESAAQDLRERLDQVSPGLGNPVMEVSVAVDDSKEIVIKDEDALLELLGNIENKLDRLNKMLEGERQHSSSTEKQDS